MADSDFRAKFAIGQVVSHRLFGYRGAVYDVDPTFQGTDDWYERNARSRPPRNEPWYRVLVDGKAVDTYVAERNLELDGQGLPIRHPMVDEVFSDFLDGQYVLRHGRN